MAHGPLLDPTFKFSAAFQPSLGSVTLATAASTSGAASRTSPATSSWKKSSNQRGSLVDFFGLLNGRVSHIFLLNFKKKNPAVS